MVSIGTTDGGADDGEAVAATAVRFGFDEVDPAAVRRIPASRIAVGVARELGLSDVDVTTLATACASGNYAIGNGFDAVRSGEADFALCGGADAMCRMTFTGFYRVKAIDPERGRPFDAQRKDPHR